MGMYGTPSPLVISCSLFALLLVNALCYVFLLQVVYRVMLEVGAVTAALYAAVEVTSSFGL